MLVGVSRGMWLPPPPSTHSAVNGEANQISAANQHFISRAIWPSANCVSFKSLSISSDPPPLLFLLKMPAFEPSFWLQGGDLHVVGWGVSGGRGVVC